MGVKARVGKVGEYLTYCNGMAFFLSFFLSSSSPAKMTRYDDKVVMYLSTGTQVPKVRELTSGFTADQPDKSLQVRI